MSTDAIGPVIFVLLIGAALFGAGHMVWHSTIKEMELPRDLGGVVFFCALAIMGIAIWLALLGNAIDFRCLGRC